ncbi:MAG: magnesium transporter [candidate division WOR-3 bacterium]|nr:MAG: magnesium transporter [candidate division WOR-3 bacterium]
MNAPDESQDIGQFDPVELARRISQLLGQYRPAELRELITPLHHTDIAEVIDRLPTQSKGPLFDLLREHDTDLAADVLLELDEESVRAILADLDREELTDLVKEMESDDAADVVARLEQEERTGVIRELPEEDRAEVSELLKYPDSSAGGRMRMEFVALDISDSVARAIERIRLATPQEVEPPVLYVVGPGRSLAGYVSLRDLLRNPLDAPVQGIMKPIRAFGRVLDDQEAIADLARKYDFSTVPVVDTAGRLAGIVTSDDILDVVVEEASEDIAKLGQTMDLEDVLAPVRSSVRGRVPWLLVSLLGGLLSSLVVLAFRSTLEAKIVVAAFMPIVAGMGGAAGNQATNIVVRALALGEVTARDTMRLLWKQVRVGLVAGAATGVLAGLLAVAVAAVLGGSPLLGCLVFLAMLMNVTIGSTAGAMTPMILARMRRDPALASSLLLTATTDMVGLFILLGLVSLALRLLRW